MSPYNQSAQASAKAAEFVDTFNTVILFPTIALLSAVAFLVFLWGVAQYFLNATNDQARQQGIKHITWGIIGLVVMISAWAILRIAAGSLGLQDELRCADDPSGSGCDEVFRLPSNSGDTGEGVLAPSETGQGVLDSDTSGDGALFSPF